MLGEALLNLEMSASFLKIIHQRARSLQQPLPRRSITNQANRFCMPVACGEAYRDTAVAKTAHTEVSDEDIKEPNFRKRLLKTLVKRRSWLLPVPSIRAELVEIPLAAGFGFGGDIRLVVNDVPAVAVTVDEVDGTARERWTDENVGYRYDSPEAMPAIIS
jgi:hypothetical protein